MQEGFFTDREIAYRQGLGHPDKRTVVFVHGLTGSASAWYEYEKVFADSHNVLTVDLRGHGLSRRYPMIDDYAISQFGADIAALLM